MNDPARTRLDELLDLLTDEVAARLRARAESAPEVTPVTEAETTPTEASQDWEVDAPFLGARAVGAEKEDVSEAEPARPPAPHAAPLLARLALIVLGIVILINLPLNLQGLALARSIPSSASLSLHNGLLVKEATSPDIYVYQNDTFHWITSLDAFEHYGYSWQNVHIVEPGYLDSFQKGSPIYVLLKCDNSPHIYRLEAGQKHWIINLATFEAQGYVWDDVDQVPCPYLHSIPDGDSIPSGHGTPPPPLP